MGFLWDGLAILAYFALVIGVGLASARRHGQNMRDFSVGSRQLPWWAVLASIVAAELSAATFLGTPGEGYHLRNFTYAQLAIGTIIARIIVAYLFIRPFYDNNVVSIYEYLQIRFGATTRDAASAVFLLTRLLASGTRLYVAAVVVVLGYEMFHGAPATPGEQIAIYGGAGAAGDGADDALHRGGRHPGGGVDRRDPGDGDGRGGDLCAGLALDRRGRLGGSAYGAEPAA